MRQKAPAAISGSGLGVALGYVVGGTAFLSLPRVVAGPAGPAAWVGIALGSAAALAAGCLILAWQARFPGLTLVGATSLVFGRPAAILVGLGLTVWGHFYLAVLLREFVAIFLIAFLPETPIAVLLGVTAALLVYAAYQGLAAIVRTAQVFLPFIAAALLVIIAGTLPRFDSDRLLPLSGLGWPGVLLAGYYTLSAFAQGLAVAPFFPLLRTPAQSRPAVIWGFALTGLVLFGLTAVEVAAFSAPVLRELTFPTLTAARVVRLGRFFERTEAALMVGWFALSFLKLALFFFFTTVTLAEVAGLETHKPLCIPGGLIVAFTALWPENFLQVIRLVGYLYRYGALAFALPAALLLASYVRGRPGRSRSLLTLLLLALTLAAGGCWSRRELEDTSFVLAIGFAEPERGRVKVVVQSALPPLLAGGGEVGGGGSGGGPTGPVWVASAEGPTVFDAQRALEVRASDQIYLAHARAIIIDERLARRGIGEILDFAYRDPEIRETLALLVTPDKSEEVLGTIPTQEKIPVFYLSNLLERARRQGTSASVDLVSYREYASLPGAAVAVPRVRIFRPPGRKQDEPPTELELSGLGVFKNDRLVGYLPPRAVPGFLWLNEEVVGLPVTFPDPRNPENLLSVEIVQASCQRRVEPDPERPEQTLIRIDIRGEANLREIGRGRRAPQPLAQVKAIDRALSREVARQVWRAVTAARQFEADIFGFGDEVRAKLPLEQWRKVAKVWPWAFAAAPLDVRVDLRLRRRGMSL